MVWHTPEEEMPPLGTHVMVEIQTGYGCRMHIYGWFEPDGWHLLRDDIRVFKVLRWSFFKKGGTG